MLLLFSVTSLVAAIALGRLIRVQRQLLAVYRDPSYGILTRAGGEAHWRRFARRYAMPDIVFLDLDGIHGLNTLLGYAEVDHLIAQALSVVRSQDLAIAMRWLSGDEIVFVTPAGDGLGLAKRVLASLLAYQLSGTFGVVHATSTNLVHEVCAAATLVQAAKRQNRRGVIEQRHAA